jgi:hypothetical protein
LALLAETLMVWIKLPLVVVSMMIGLEALLNT